MSERIPRVLQGPDVIDMLVQIWMDGFTSGSSTVLGSVRPDLDDATIDEITHSGVDGVRRDPAAMLMVENEVKERLAGIDSGGKSISVRLEANG